MHPAVVPIAGSLALLSLLGLRIRAVMNSKKVQSFADPAARPPPAASAAERSVQQEKLVKEVLAAPPPARVFKAGELIGVDVFSAGLEISTMSDVRNPRPGLVTGIVNMKVMHPDPPGFGARQGKMILAEFADERFFVEPMFDQDMNILDVPIPKASVAAAPDPAGGRSGMQGVPNPVQLFQAQSDPLPTPVKLSPIPSVTLRQGSTGEAVKAWQTFLAARGFDVGALDGVFGAKTHAATVAFQKAANLVADGVAGPKTFAIAAA